MDWQSLVYSVLSLAYRIVSLAYRIVSLAYRTRALGVVCMLQASAVRVHPDLLLVEPALSPRTRTERRLWPTLRTSLCRKRYLHTLHTF